ncbi:hypothetical protein HYZ76_01310, partial [Candidatus Falkowbacteria bacterium]|nr:hypothetical protein [Candidatus Falkowbacteria bacterium]
AGVSGFVLFSFHPFHVLSVFAVISASFLVLMIKEKKILWYLVRYYLVFNLLSTPAILYYFYLLKVDPVWSQKALQNLTFITPLWITLFSYGLLLVFAVVGAYLLIKQKNTSAKFIFIISWAAAQFLVLYSPVNFQRRMTEGLHFPLVILTAVALFFIYSQIKQQNTALKKFLFSQRYAVLMILVVLFTASNFFLLAVDGYIYFSRREMSYIDKSYIEAAEWLKKVPADAIIFNSSRTFVNPVPAYSGRTVYVGHGVETPFFRQKENEVKWFFNRNRSEDIELVFLKKRNIDYIFYTPAERALGDYQPENKSYLNEVFGNQAVKIYAVLSSENL